MYIIVTGTGLDENLDFGAGAYYYTDIPEFEKIVNNESYSPAISTPLAIFLFLAWGAFAYWLWKKIG
ncbi:MAG: hypothetical protein HUJ91_07210 [Bacteroidales bacterium]|nr:hypothetical protein [Bacteroidales bacterium]